MKFKIVDDFEEEFTSKQNRQAHYSKHVEKNKEFQYSEEEYERRADELSRKKIDNKNIFGYVSMTRDGRTANCKYDKNAEEFVVYTNKNDTPYTITMYRKNWREYTGDKAIEYFGEISE